MEVKPIFILNAIVILALACSPHCQRCDSAGLLCSSCKQGFDVTPEGQCVQSQNSKYDFGGGLISVSNGLEPVQIKDCVEKIGKRCTSCLQGFYITAQGECNILPEGCAFANVITGTCLRCTQAYQLNKQAACIRKVTNCEKADPTVNRCLVCKPRFYGERCQPVSALCARYDAQTGKCLSCLQGFLLNQGEGICLDRNCKTYNSSTERCQQCKDKFGMKTQRYCILDDDNCLEKLQERCFECKEKFFTTDDGHCEKLPPNCLQVVAGACRFCDKGYTLQKGLCEKGSDSADLIIFPPPPNKGDLVILPTADPNCVQFKGPLCVKCKDKYTADNGFCRAKDPNCKNQGPTKCLECHRGYELFFGRCLLKLMADENCAKKDHLSRCISCSYGYYLKGEKCEAVNPLCYTSNPNNGQCLTCYPGYQLVEASCKIVFVDPYCAQSDQAKKCLQCAPRYYLDSKKSRCKGVSSLCKEYNATDGRCTGCYTGYSLKTKAGKCTISALTSDQYCKKFAESTCVECYRGHYPLEGVCSPVDKLCKEADQKGRCTSCWQGYTLTAGKCHLDLSKQRDPNCSNFEDAGQKCVKCFRGYYPSDSKCKKANPLCMKSIPENGDCASCYPGYQLAQGNCRIPSRRKK